MNVVKLMMNLLLTPISDLGRSNCDDNGSECVVSRDKGLCILFNTDMLKGGGINLYINTQSTFNPRKIRPSHVWACLLPLQL